MTDELTSKMLCEGKTGAVFQMESAGMTQLVRDLAPENFADLIPLVALYRPGPLGSGMVEDFIKGRHGEKEVTYMHPLLEPILKETFGVVLYQEQVMQIVQVLAGFTLGQADLLRRAMGKKKHEILMAQKENFLAGCEKNHIEAGLATTIFDLLTHFADYGFNKSHSAAYALVAWQTAYLKAHYPAEFMAAMLTSIMDTPKVATYIELCRRMDIKILPPDINASSAYFSVDGAAIRFGLAAVRNVGETAIENVARIREDGGPFSSLSDFCRRVDMRVVNRRVIESLIKCGAFDSFGAKRSQLLAILPQTVMEAAQQQKDAVSGQMGLFSDETIEETGMLQLPDIDEVPKAELLNWEKEATGFYITGHPLDQYAAKLENLPHIGSLQPDAVRDKQVVRIGGMLTEAKRITTKKGDTMCFATVEDFTDSVEVTVFPRTFYQNMNLLVPDTPVVVQGRIDMTDESVKIIADSVWALKDYRFAYYIELPPGGLPETKREEMKQLIAAHHGAYATFFHSGGHWQKARENFWLDDAAETFQRLESIVGAGKVRKR